MKTLEFDLVEWHGIYPKAAGYSKTKMINLKRQYFIGDAFKMAFPLQGKEQSYAWNLDGTALLKDGSEIEFSWRPDGVLTFTEFMCDSAVSWAKSMEDVAPNEIPVSIKCKAYVNGSKAAL